MFTYAPVTTFALPVDIHRIRVQSLLEKAKKEFSASKYETVLSYLKPILEAQPYHSEALRLRVMTYNNTQQLVALTKDSEAMRTSEELRLEEQFTRKYNTAFKRFLGASKKDDILQVAAKHAFLAREHQIKKEYKEAIEQAKQAIDLIPEDVLTSFIFIESVYILKDHSHYERALSLLTTLTTQEKYDSPHLWLMQSRLHLELKNPEGATRCFITGLHKDITRNESGEDKPYVVSFYREEVSSLAQTLEATHVNLPIPAKPLEEKTILLNKQAKKHLERKNYPGAIKTCNQSLLASPENIEFYITRGDAYHAMKTEESRLFAIRDFTTALWLFNNVVFYNEVVKAKIILLYMRTRQAYLELEQFLESWLQHQALLKFIKEKDSSKPLTQEKNNLTFQKELFEKMMSHMINSNDVPKAIGVTNVLLTILVKATKLTSITKDSINFYFGIADRLFNLAKKRAKITPLTDNITYLVDALVDTTKYVLIKILNARPTHTSANRIQEELNIFASSYKERQTSLTLPLEAEKKAEHPALDTSTKDQEEEKSNSEELKNPPTITHPLDKKSKRAEEAKAKKIAGNARRKEKKKLELIQTIISDLMKNVFDNVKTPSAQPQGFASEQKRPDSESRVNDRVPEVVDQPKVITLEQLSQATESMDENEGRKKSAAPASGMSTTTHRIQLPMQRCEQVILHALSEDGKIAHMKGSRPRQRMLLKGVDPTLYPDIFYSKKDIDIYTTSSHEKITALFLGIAPSPHIPGLYSYVIKDDLGNDIQLEISTKPQLSTELPQFDFTLNAFILDAEGNVYDPTERGVSDHERRQIDTALTPGLSFMPKPKGDPLRVLRAFYAEVEANRELEKKCALDKKNGVESKLATDIRPFKIKDLVQTAIRSIRRLIVDESDEKEIGRFNGWFFKLFYLENNVDHFNALLDANMFEKLFSPDLVNALRTDREWICQELKLALKADRKQLDRIYLIFLVSAYQLKGTRSPFYYDSLVQENALLIKLCGAGQSHLNELFDKLVERWEKWTPSKVADEKAIDSAYTSTIEAQTNYPASIIPEWDAEAFDASSSSTPFYHTPYYSHVNYYSYVNMSTGSPVVVQYVDSAISPGAPDTTPTHLPRSDYPRYFTPSSHSTSSTSESSTTSRKKWRQGSHSGVSSSQRMFHHNKSTGREDVVLGEPTSKLGNV